MMVWEMFHYLPEAIHLCAVLDQMYHRFCFDRTKNYLTSDLVQNEFLSGLVHIINQVPTQEVVAGYFRGISLSRRACDYL